MTKTTMRQSTGMLALAVGVGLALSAPVWAAMEESTEPKPSAEQPSAVEPTPTPGQRQGALKQASGRITAVDPKTHALTLNIIAGALPGSTNFTVDPRAVISREGQSIALNQLKAGDQVDVQYAMEGNRHVAQAITVKEGKSPTRG